MSYIETQELIEYHIRLSKEKSSFLYFILESNENLCFYSTLPFEKGSTTRELCIRCTPELEEQVAALIEHCQSKFDIEIISCKTIKDN